MDENDRVSKLDTKLEGVMERADGRFLHIERELADVKAEVAFIKSNYVTRADLMELEHRLEVKLDTMARRFIVIVTAMTSIQIAVMVYLIRAIH